MGGSRERTNGVREFCDRGSSAKNSSCSRKATQFSAPHATSGQPLHVSSWPNRFDDSAVGCRAPAHRFRLLSAGTLLRVRKRQLNFRGCVYSHKPLSDYLDLPVTALTGRNKSGSSSQHEP